jgi:hypothetical protein
MAKAGSPGSASMKDASEPGVLVSYLGQKNGFEFTTYIGYDINTKNTETIQHEALGEKADVSSWPI